MKKLTILFPALFVMLFFTQCNNTSTDNLTGNADTRSKIISELMNNDAYMAEVMDSMKSKHAMSGAADAPADDKAMQMDMMSKMMEKCKSDTVMCKMMMDKTMDMCDMDTAKCKMMMESMMSHPKSMKSMKDMGMCDMKNTKMDGMKNMKGMEK